jgi:hypothetical protein
MWTIKFWKQVLERAIKTAAQGIVAIIGVDGLGFLDIGLKQAALVGLFAALASVLTSIASAPLSGDPASPSLVDTAPVPPAPVSPAAPTAPASGEKTTA